IFASPKIYNITGVCTQALDPYWPGCSTQTKNLPCTDQYGCWPYAKADIHYNWVSAAIDNARSLGIKWTIVATHKDCISASDATLFLASSSIPATVPGSPCLASLSLTRATTGCWPTTAFLDNEGRIITGGTYIPPEQLREYWKKPRR